MRVGRSIPPTASSASRIRSGARSVVTRWTGATRCSCPS